MSGCRGGGAPAHPVGALAAASACLVMLTGILPSRLPDL
jgi:hypothetical protein